MLCRLLFLYFLQKRGYLDGDPCYLPNHLQRTRERYGTDMFYRAFLLRLFQEGLGTTIRTPETHALFGNIPYLGGDFFLLHQLEYANPQLHISDEAFRRLFTFFESYQWHLDEHPRHYKNEITPGVLGYILEKYINQQQVGAYFTREDVTHYIASSTIIPSLLDHVAQSQSPDTEHPFPRWSLLQTSPDDYIPMAIRIREMQADETDRTYAERRAYYETLYTRLASGQVRQSDDLVTFNLDSCRFARDAILAVTSPDLLYLIFTSLQALTVLDPTCGSGAFLLAALHVLEPLYEACLDRIHYVTTHIQPDKRLTALLTQVEAHTHRSYFIRKTILTHNLYGVDLVEEAATVCKLRLYLALIAQSTAGHAIEPLPTIHKNIRTGNALVGIVQAKQLRTANRKEQRLVLDQQLAQDYQVDIGDSAACRNWRTTHQPFHWPVEFGDIFKQGGFRVIIGNPPYVEYYRQHFAYTLCDYETLSCANLYPCVIERSRQLLAPHGRHGMIVPLSAFTTKNMTPLLDGFLRWFPQSWLSFYHFRPSMLFSGGKTANIPTVIYLARTCGPEQRFSTCLNKWATGDRHQVFQRLRYSLVTIARDSENSHYYPKFGSTLENNIMRKVLDHSCIHRYITNTSEDNAMFYRSAGGLYWKVFTNFPWPYQTTSNKQCSFQPAYKRDVFVALLNSSLFWWYYTVTFDSFNLKDYMLFGFRFTYPDDPQTVAALTTLCQQLMDDFRRHARHLTRGTTGSYTIYARKSKHIIDAIDCVLAPHYQLTNDELDFILYYDLKYRLGR
jgi:hypothetical protein